MTATNSSLAQTTTDITCENSISLLLSVAPDSISLHRELARRNRRKETFRRIHVVLINFVKQRSIAHLQQPCRRLAIPAGLLQRGADRIPLRLGLHILDQRLQRFSSRNLVLAIARE